MADGFSSDDFPDRDLEEQIRRKPVYERLADNLMNQYNFKTMRDNEDMYYFDEGKGIYILAAERLIKESVQSVRPQIKTNEVHEVINNISRRTGIDREQVDADPKKVTIANGELEIIDNGC